ncbi:hypothetical protein DICPUDRAFT_83936 [Dictyostelium purpureum]|uniref:Uncharacterized protein n=1 Tax=Dictyostelium purpureum TaxID=5786 RepID=F1A140_DICPU|nr:uncharacterized protein DICPUDRAFT_83936 [Dictyostelium purpureum]EGC30093.1 hypothetical protein DICPUDRAFT_83936 [Dictyostelium purpureum]|eukprot:XP_003293380.1 hypothetical protein DICPUDRAFT_83936 [Dictyostelium purpureum]
MLSLTNKLLKNSNSNKSLLLFLNCGKLNFTSTKGIEKEFEKESKKETERYHEELDDFYSNGKEKLSKSKRLINQKKSKRVAPVEVFRNAIDSNKDAPQVDYVEGKLHSFPPLPGSRRTKLRNYEEDEDDYNDYEDYGVQTKSKNKYNSKKSRRYEEDDEDDEDFEDIEDFEELENIKPPVEWESSEKDDFDKEDWERGFYNEAEIRKLKHQAKLKREKEIFMAEQRKKRLLKSGFQYINDVEKKRTDLAAQIREKGDRRLKHFKHPILSENDDLALITFKFFKLLYLTNEDVLYNDDVLDIPSKISVQDVDGTKIGEMTGPEAYRIAYIRKLDIFLQYTPVGSVIARLMRMEDFIKITEKKFLEENQKKLDSATKQTKNVLFSSTISENDKQTKINQVKNFLLKRHTVEATLTFKEVIDDSVATEFFEALESQLTGIAKPQANYGKKGGKIASRFYHPLNVKDRDNYLKKMQKDETESEKRLREQLEREEIDRCEERGEEPDMAAISVKVSEIVRKKRLEELFDEKDLFLLMEDERKNQKKVKNEYLNQEKNKLAPTAGETLSNKQIKQNINKNKNKLKREQKDEEELF